MIQRDAQQQVAADSPAFGGSAAELGRWASQEILMRNICRTRVFAAALFLACGQTAAAAPADVSLVISGVTPGEGQLRVALCDQQTFLKAPCFKQAVKRVESAPQRVILDGIPPGKWAVAVVYDLNGNERLDKNILGIPKEPYGFSRNSAALFGPPDFKDAAFELKGEPALLDIQLK